MKSLLKLINPNRFWVILSIFVSFVSIGLHLLWSLSIGNLSDKIVTRGAVTTEFIIMMLVLLVGVASFQYINQIVSRYTSEKMAHTLRMNFAGALLSNDNIQKNITGYEAMSKVQNELQTASEYMSNTLFDIVNMALSGLFTLIFFLFENSLLTGIILASMVPVIVITKRLGKNLVPLVNRSMDKKVEHNKIAYSMINNFDTLLIFDGKEYFENKYEEKLDSWAEVETKKERINAFCNSMSGILSQIPLLTLFFAGGLMIWKGAITIGTLVIFLNMIGNLLRTLMNLPSWMISVKNFLVHLKRADLSEEV